MLLFPNQDTFRLALTSALVPEEVGLAPVHAEFGEDGEIYVEPSQSIPQTALGQLRQLGVRSPRSAKRINIDKSFRCWHQLLPLTRSEFGNERGDQPVLFELAGDDQLPQLVAEMLRLGNDRQSFFYLSSGSEIRTMLRVIGPPYYSLLRALERDGQDSPRAYVEQNSRVWVEIGYQHGLANHIKPPPGKLLLLRPPREWLIVDEAPLRDIYELLDFQLPASPTDWQQAQLDRRIEVPLRLAAGGGNDTAELWVLRDGGADEVEQLVQNSDDHLLRRLMFAVGKSGGKTSIVLRVRPSKEPPPVLVLRGQSFRQYLHLPNLFMPVGQRLHPPLRRDAVAARLGRGKDEIVWLYPNDDGLFTPESIPDAAFRPLSDWVDYVLDREHEPLAAWVASHRFDFESFVCADDLPVKAKPPKRPRPEGQPREDESQDKQSGGPRKQQPTEKESQRAEANTLKLGAGIPKKRKPTEMQKRLRDVEQQFRESDSPLDSQDRRPMWREMALLHTALHHRLESTVCWSNALWEESAPQAEALAAWLDCEKRGAPKVKFTEATLDGLAQDNASRPAEASVYAAYVVSAAFSAERPQLLVERLPLMGRFLERQEPYLPVRTIWLAWQAMTELGGGDVLALALARDRLLERLFHHGLRPELDMPSFLRVGGGEKSERFGALRQHVVRLQQQSNKWIVEPPMGDSPQTKAYADLIFAFALARLGETQQCQALVAAADKTLEGKDELHDWVRDAYGQRISEALEGQASRGRLDEELLNRLETMDRLQRYKLDRLRNYSRVLEPTERVDPYRRWHQRYTDDLSRQLAGLMDVNDREQLRSELEPLVGRLQDSSVSSVDQVRILDSALELSPRLGETFAEQMLSVINPVLGGVADVVSRAVLLEQGLIVAAHFDKAEHVQSLVVQFERELPTIVSTYLKLNIQQNPENKEKIDTIDGLFSESFRGMRKLGMREEIGRLFGRLDTLLHERSSKRGKSDVDTVRSQKLLLSVASGWFYFGQHDPAVKIADEVRETLFSEQLSPIDQRTLACAYIHAVGQASVEWSLPRIEELLAIKNGRRRLDRIEDNMTTASHFSISQLDMIETLVLTLVSDDFSLSAESRRWLDEDEFLVRRRNHRDMRTAMHDK